MKRGVANGDAVVRNADAAQLEALRAIDGTLKEILAALKATS